MKPHELIEHQNILEAQRALSDAAFLMARGKRSMEKRMNLLKAAQDAITRQLLAYEVEQVKAAQPELLDQKAGTA